MLFIDYLTKQSDLYQDRIYDKEKELDDVLFELKENKRFSELLESEKRVSFTEFTPQVVSSTEKKVHEELSSQETLLLTKRDHLEEEISLLKSEKSHLDDAIRDAKDTIRGERKRQISFNESIRSNLEEVLSYFEERPERAKEHLKEIIDKLKDR